MLNLTPETAEMTIASPPRTTNSRRQRKVERYMSMMNSMRASVPVKLKKKKKGAMNMSLRYTRIRGVPKSQADSDALHGGDTCFGDLVIDTLCKISRKGSSDRSSTFGGETTGLERVLYLVDRLLSDIA